MRTEFRKAVLPRELRSLVAFDRRVFSVSDSFAPVDWESYESYWMLVGGKKVGCCAFVAHVDFQEDIRQDGLNPRRTGCLYIVTTGILPEFQRLGFGQLLKSWQISYARFHGFHRIVTNTRKRNAAMIALNRKLGFRVVRTTRGYYSDPPDSTVVMELRLAPPRNEQISPSASFKCP